MPMMTHEDMMNILLKKQQLYLFITYCICNC